MPSQKKVAVLKGLSFKACSHQAKEKPNIFFDLCRFFCDVFVCPIITGGTKKALLITPSCGM